MDKDFEIEIQPEKEELTSSVQLPVNFLSFGEIENDDVKVYIKQTVYKALEKLASSDTSKELGSIIIGDFSQEMGKMNVIISDYIEAKYTDASASTLTFTHETWDYVHSEHEKLYPNKKIVGWQHTHPNYGIFLSNYDLFIQENFFNMPFQVAYVIDPVHNTRGFFQWKDGKITKLKGFYIYDDIGKPVKIEQAKVAKKENIPKKIPLWMTALITLLCAATIVLSFFTISLHNKYKQQIIKQGEIIEEINSQDMLLNDQANTIAKLQEQLINSVLDNSGKTTASNLVTMLENNEIKLNNQEKVLTELKEFVKGQNDNNTAEITFFAYKVAEGDSLYKICKEHELDYNANIRIIIAINGISDPNRIYVGQTILLPFKND